MQRVIYRQAIDVKFHSQATRMVPGHGTGVEYPASNDETYLQKEPVFKMILSVLMNVIGGTLLLAAMFSLPIMLAAILDF